MKKQANCLRCLKYQEIGAKRHSQITGSLPEGDPLEIFWIRGSEYPDTVEIAASYPSIENQSKITEMLEASDYRKWFVHCLKCGHEYIMLRSHIRYPKDQPELAELECPSCSAMLTDRDRLEMMRGGHWKPTQPFKGIRGYWANRMLDPVSERKGYRNHLHWTAEQEIRAEKAKNKDRAKRVLVNTFDALAYRPEMVEQPDYTALYMRREDYDAMKVCPTGVLAITAGVDVQKTWIEVTVLGAGKRGQQWVLMHRKIHGVYDKSQTWKKLDQLLSRQFKVSIGEGEDGEPIYTQIRINSAFVDAGHWNKHVYAYTRRKASRRIFASLGARTINAPAVGTRSKKGNPPAIAYMIGTHLIKDEIYGQLSLDTPPEGEEYAEGFIHFPVDENIDEDYFSGLTCEEGLIKYVGGEAYTFYENTRKERNEPLDCLVYAKAAMVLLNPNWDAIERNLGERIDPKPAKEPRKQNRQPIRPAHSSWATAGIGTGWLKKW